MARRCALLPIVVLCLLLPGCNRERSLFGGPVITDDWGREVTLAAPARRVVSLAPATTELVFALGAGERLVGRTTWCDYPAAAATVTDVGNGIGPNVEAIAAQRPELVLLYPSESNRAALRQLEDLGIRVAVLEQDAIHEWLRTTDRLATLLDRQDAADSLVAVFNARMDSVVVDRRDGAPRVFIAVGANPPIAIGAGSFVSELVVLAGGSNAFHDITGPSAVVSLEAIVARQPDVVLVLGPDSVTGSVARRPGWRAIPAVRRQRIIAVDGSEFNRPSPRLPDAVRALSVRLAALRP